MNVSTAIRTGSVGRRRVLLFVLLTLGEIFLTSYFFNFGVPGPEWANPVAYAKVSAQAGLVAFIVLAFVAWPKRYLVLDAWHAALPTWRWHASLAGNLALFTLLIAASIAFSVGARTTEAPWIWFSGYCALLIATAISLGFLAAPSEFWRWMLRHMPSEIGIAVIGGVLIVGFGRLALEGWSTLAAATLNASHWILSLYESDVVLDADRMLLGAGDFSVLVVKQCSGYEGIGLVTAFLALYCWWMRNSLRFPQALLLIPIGIAASWVLNSVRIAVLVSVGRHVSPEMALNGFHSQAGWIAFLGIAIGLMFVSSRVPYFQARSEVVSEVREQDRLVLAFLAPFMALMATTILASLFVPHDQWLYPLKVIAVGAALIFFRRIYASFDNAVSPAATLVGVIVGAAWIATDPAPPGATALGSWLATLPAWLALSWLAFRGLGTIVMIPIAEELAFRGYLQRALISLDFHRVAPGQFTWLSFVATSLLFGLMHQRWLAAAVAGAAFALLVYRSNRLSDAIVAHAIANAVIFFWAVLFAQWTLL